MLNILQPRLRAHHIHELDISLLTTRDILGVLLDLDNTLTPWNSREVPAEVVAWVEQLRAEGIAACIVSNAFTARRVRPVAERLQLPWVTRAGKPLARGFRQGLALLGATPETTAMIGDQMFTDILGGNLLGLYTILVEPISNHEALPTRLIQRPLERLLGRK